MPYIYLYILIYLQQISLAKNFNQIKKYFYFTFVLIPLVIYCQYLTGILSFAVSFLNFLQLFFLLFCLAPFFHGHVGTISKACSYYRLAAPKAYVKTQRNVLLSIFGRFKIDQLIKLDYSKRPKLRSIDVPGWSWSVVASMVRLSKRSFQSSKNLISRIG